MPAPYTLNTADVPIVKMVYNRLPFLEDTADNDDLISAFVLEMMAELEVCFETGDIGNEAAYTAAQKGCIADFTAYYIVLLTMSGVTGAGSDGGGGTASTFLSKAKAGSVEVEYDQFNIKEGASIGLLTSGDNLLAFYKESALRRSIGLGCSVALPNIEGGELVVGDRTASLLVAEYVGLDS